MAEQTTNYVPGICNINTKEVAKRRKAGYFGLVLTIALAGILFGFDLTRYARVILFVPLFVSAIGFLQAKNKFCVGYGAAGIQNADEGSADASKVTDASALAKDKQRTNAMYLQAIAAALLATMLLILF